MVLSNPFVFIGIGILQSRAERGGREMRHVK
jgi:hypothetical protein